MNDTANNDGIPAEVAKWLKAIVGEYMLAGNYRKHSERTGVWRIQAAGGMSFLKIHKEKRKWHPEVYAYQNWASAYEPYVPRLIAVYESPEAQGVLMSGVEGQPLRQADLPEKQVLLAYETAGRLARQTHTLEVGPFFGLPDCKGRPQGETITDPVEYMTRDLQR
ncbi:MAG: aminoglycoside phosphotransferase family protein, partial [Actinomycetia bacterium]|nr:aminoglycoside phosphotransferase family protein [Actinomycetes bacterium]